MVDKKHISENTKYPKTLISLIGELYIFLTSFLNFKTNSCQLTAFTDLEIYIMTEGFGTSLAIGLVDMLEGGQLLLKNTEIENEKLAISEYLKRGNEFKFNITGLVLNDPIINYKR